MLRNRFITFFITFWCFLLFGCAKENPTTAIAENIKSDIIVIEHQIQDVKDNLPKECQTSSVKASLTTIQENVKNIKGKVDSQVVVCNTQNAVLEQKISKLKIIIGFLILLFGGFIILKIKKIL